MFEHSYFPANQNTHLMQRTKELIAESAIDLIPSWLSSAGCFRAYFCTMDFDDEHRMSSTDMMSMPSFINISTLVQADKHADIMKKIKILDK
jgi:hypothetical protein